MARKLSLTKKFESLEALYAGFAEWLGVSPDSLRYEEIPQIKVDLTEECEEGKEELLPELQEAEDNSAPLPLISPLPSTAAAEASKPLNSPTNKCPPAPVSSTGVSAEDILKVSCLPPSLKKSLLSDLSTPKDLNGSGAVKSAFKPPTSSSGKDAGIRYFWEKPANGQPEPPQKRPRLSSSEETYDVNRPYSLQSSLRPPMEQQSGYSNIYVFGSSMNPVFHFHNYYYPTDILLVEVNTSKGICFRHFSGIDNVIEKEAHFDGCYFNLYR